MSSRKTLAEARRRKDLTQEDLALRLGTTQATISRIERGAAVPDAAEAQQLIAILGVTLDDCVRIDPESEDDASNDIRGAAKATG